MCGKALMAATVYELDSQIPRQEAFFSVLKAFRSAGSKNIDARCDATGADGPPGVFASLIEHGHSWALCAMEELEIEDLRLNMTHGGH